MELTDEQRMRNSPNHGPEGDLRLSDQVMLGADTPGIWRPAQNMPRIERPEQYVTTTAMRDRLTATFDSASRFRGSVRPHWMRTHGVTHHGDYMGLPVYTHPDMPENMAFFVTREPVVVDGSLLAEDPRLHPEEDRPFDWRRRQREARERTPAQTAVDMLLEPEIPQEEVNRRLDLLDGALARRDDRPDH